MQRKQLTQQIHTLLSIEKILAEKAKIYVPLSTATMTLVNTRLKLKILL